MTPDYWPQAIAHLGAHDPVLGRIIEGYPNETLQSRDDPFGTLARAITGQQISVAAAEEAHLVWRWMTRQGVQIVDASGALSLPMRPVPALP